MSEYSKRLKAMQDNFETAQTDYKNSYSPTVPPGIYSFKLSRFELGETSNENVAVFREQVITEGEQKGETVFDMFALETDFGMKRCLLFFDQLGYEIDGLKAEDIEQIAADILKDAPEYKARLRYSKKGGFANLNIMEVYESENDGSNETEQNEGTEEEGSEGTGDGSDDILEKMKEFCSIRGIEVHDDDDLDAVKEVLSAYEFKSNEMDSDELTLFTEAGFDDLIEDDTPPPPKKETPAKKPSGKKTSAASKEKSGSSRIRKKK